MDLENNNWNLDMFNKKKEDLIALSNINRLEADSKNRVRLIDNFTHSKLRVVLKEETNRYLKLKEFKSKMDCINYNNNLTLQTNIELLTLCYDLYGHF